MNTRDKKHAHTKNHTLTRECVPAGWSHHRGCRSPPGSRRPRRSPLCCGSHTSTQPGLCEGRSGQCRLESLLNSQAFSCRSSGACSSCSAARVRDVYVIKHSDHTVSTQMDHFLHFSSSSCSTYPAGYLSLRKVCSESLWRRRKFC